MHNAKARSFVFNSGDMMRTWSKWVLSASTTALLALGLVGCGGSHHGGGSLVKAPLATASLSPDAVKAAAPSLVAVVGEGTCTVNFHSYAFTTFGGAREEITSTAAIITPSGSDVSCSGARPVVLYAHGTVFDKNFNMASPSAGEAMLVAASYAAHGYIVVAPNYAGYDSSTLSYHPYLMMNQQAGEMVDAWNAVKSQLPGNLSSNGKLFVAGYSQGGHVAMATQRALQLAGTPVTAAAPMSGPYALGSFIDAIMGGVVGGGATAFAPMLITAAQKAYGNVYTNTSDVYESAYATGIEGLLPSTISLTTLMMQGKLPVSNLFAADSLPQPVGTFGFGTGNLLKTSFRNAMLADLQANGNSPQFPMRLAAYRNDLLRQDWVPNKPMLLCAGNADPVVYYSVNTSAAKSYFDGKGVSALVTVLDVDSAASGPSDPFAAVKAGFAMAKAGAGSAALEKYHGELVPPFCQAAARGFFANF